MINQELIKYIEFHLKNGSSWEKIKSDLMAAGWPNDAIEENYSQIEKSKPTVQEIKPLELVAEEKPVQQNLADSFREPIDDTLENLSANELKPNEPVTEWPGVKENIQPSVTELKPANFEQPKPITPIEPVRVAEPPVEKIVKPQKSFKGLIVGIISILLVVLAGGGAFAYYQYFYPQQLIASAIQDLLKTSPDKYFETSVLLTGDLSSKENMFTPHINNTAYNYGSLTFNAKVDIDTSDTNNLKATLSQNGEFTIKPSKDSTNSLSMSESFDGIENSNISYFKLNSVQGLENFGQQDSIIQFINQNLNQWFELSSDQTGGATSSEEIMKQRQEFLALFTKDDLSKIMQYKVLGSEKIENDDCFKYQVSFSKDALKNFLIKDQDLSSDEKVQISTNFDNNVWPVLQKSDFKVWVTKNNPYFRKYQIVYSDKFEDSFSLPLSEVSLNLQLIYKKLSAGAVTINVPQNIKSAVDLMASYDKISLQAQKISTSDNKIKSTSYVLQQIAKFYQEQNKTYLNFVAKGDGLKLIQEINQQGGRAAFIYITKDKYCITKELIANPGTYWCIDNSGYYDVSNNCTKKTYSCK